MPKSSLSRWTLALIAILVSFPAYAQDSDTETSRPRSVLFYLVDTCRHDRMAYDGYERETTPFLEWLAERSVVFEACYSQAPWTKPSMASMLSSQYPSTTGVYKMLDRLPSKFVTLPEVLQSNGIYTAGFSANIVMGNTLSAFAQGFDHFVESTDINRGDPIRFASGSAKKLNDHAFRWLDATDHWPMFLYLHSVDPHEEYEPEPEYLSQFADPNRHDQYRLEWKKLLQSRPPIPGLYVTQDNFDRTGVDSGSFISHGSDLYDADIRANDDQMKILWDKLKEDGWGDDFIFVFTSDHGEEFFDHGGTCHGYSLYDEMIRVPLMIYAPGLLPGGKKITTPVRSLDIYPTICDLLGVDAPDDLEGESLVPLIRGSAKASDRLILSEHREDAAARRIGQGSGVLVSVRQGRWKFILNQTSSQLIERPRFELYDLDADPEETTNLSEQHPEVVKELEAEVIDFISEHREDASIDDWRQIDEKVLAQLRALGYIGDEEPGASGGSRPATPEPNALADTELFGAIARGDAAGVEKALADGASLKVWDPNTGWTPLTTAVYMQKPEIAGLLIQKGARPYKRNRDMSTTLHGAAVMDNTAMLQLLLANGADVDARDTNGATALHAAAFLGRVDATVLLLRSGADRRMKDVNGMTPLAVTTVDWQTTQMVMQMIGSTLQRDDVESGRLEVAKKLEE